MKPQIGQRWRWNNRTGNVNFIIEVVDLLGYENGVKGKLIQVIENELLKRFVGDVQMYTVNHSFWEYLIGQDVL